MLLFTTGNCFLLLRRYMRVIFILHGAKKAVKKLPPELNKLRPRDVQFYFCFTTDFGSGKQIAYENARKADLFIIVGGDGILNECLNGLMIFKRENPDDATPALGLLPHGSGNDFSRSFNWKRKSVEDLLNRLIKKQFIEVDVGTITHANGRIEYFLNEASTGISADVVERVSKMPNFLNGNIRFGWAILECFIRYKKRKISLKSVDFEWSEKTLLIACSNGRYFGSGIAIAPDANLTDGLLNVIVIGNVSVWDYLRQLPKLRKGIKINHPQVHYFTTNQIHLSGDWKMEKDGEIAGDLPCTISIQNKTRILA